MENFVQMLCGQSLILAGKKWLPHVRELDALGGRLRFLVGEHTVWVRLSAKGQLEMAGCSCAPLSRKVACAHVAAVLSLLEEQQRMESPKATMQRTAGAQLLSYYDTPPKDGQLSLEITLVIGKDALGVSLKIGQERLYVVRSMARFLAHYRKGVPLSFGKGFTYEPQIMTFSAQDTRFLHVLCEASLSPLAQEQTRKALPLDVLFLPRVLRLLLGRQISIFYAGELLEGMTIQTQTLPLVFAVRGEDDELLLDLSLPSTLRMLTKDCEFVRDGARIFRLPPAQQEALRPMLRENAPPHQAFRFASHEAGRVISEVLPRLEQVGKVTICEELQARLVQAPLVSKVYLDREREGIFAKVEFCYDSITIDPFSPTPAYGQGNGILLVRDTVREQDLLGVLETYAFTVQMGRAHLHGEALLYDFLVNGIAQLSAICQVYCAQGFSLLTPRRVKLAGQFRSSGSMLCFDMIEGVDAADLQGVLEALSSQKKYVRLTDGSFLSLQEHAQWGELAGYLTEAGTVTDGRVELSMARGAYLSSILDEAKVSVTADEGFSRATNVLQGDGQPCPESLDHVLRPYQKRGFSWMQALYCLRLGGVLADDMGLGKTLQVIALMLWSKQESVRAGEEEKPSLVVAPSSLTYNWQQEVQSFAPDLRVRVVEGSAPQRKAQASDLDGVDVLIVSYAQLRRDGDDLAEIPFRFVVLDEAQQIKNAGSVGAKAAGKLRAECRFALTGTPMENHVGELWSIFDFALPGYLLEYNTFMRRHGEGQESSSLKRKIAPFLMRRLKVDVLPELPEKIEHRMPAELLPEQKKVYQATLYRLQEELSQAISKNGFDKSRMKLLWAITRLRQVCCHPSLVLKDFEGESGKLELLVDIVRGAKDAGHRVLVFSQFTTMLRMIEKRFEHEEIDTLYLDGHTPAQERLGMCDTFNQGKGDAFLISLKAGGTGLNLTGADTVVLYDPWWNPAVEDQAADRVHRIGQTKAVQVIRLITRDTIEEQVFALCQKKKALFDQMVGAGSPEKLTPEELRALFSL